MTFYTGNNNIFYLELAMDRTEFIKVVDFEPQERPDPDALMAQANASAPPQRLNRPAARTPTNCSSPWACRPRPCGAKTLTPADVSGGSGKRYR